MKPPITHPQSNLNQMAWTTISGEAFFVQAASFASCMHSVPLISFAGCISPQQWLLDGLRRFCGSDHLTPLMVQAHGAFVLDVSGCHGATCNFDLFEGQICERLHITNKILGHQRGSQGTTGPTETRHSGCACNCHCGCLQLRKLLLPNGRNSQRCTVLVGRTPEGARERGR
jgi:hypothetical protein